MLLPKDYVRLRLTGEHAIDVADASGTLLFDVAARALERGRARRARAARGEWLPASVAATSTETVARRRRPGGRRARRRRRPARARCRSCSARRASCSRRCRRTAPTPRRALHVFCHAVPGTWHAMGVMLSAAGRCAGCATPSRRQLRRARRRGRRRGRPGAEGLLFLPYLAGERTPHADPDARGAFVGLSLRHDRGALVARGARGRRVRAARLARAPARARRRAPTVGRVSGGGARSELWLRIVASVLGLPLERTAVEEGAAFGAALLGGVAAGIFADAAEAVAACVRVVERIEPDREWRDLYADGVRALRQSLPGAASAGGAMTSRSERASA